MRQRLRGDLKESMKTKTQTTTVVIKSILSEITYAEKANSKESVVSIIQRGIKQRQDAVCLYEKGERLDLAKQEKDQIALLIHYLPPQMTHDQIRNIAREVILELGVKNVKELGRVMGELTKRIPEGTAPKKEISLIVKELLSM